MSETIKHKHVRVRFARKQTELLMMELQKTGVPSEKIDEFFDAAGEQKDTVAVATKFGLKPLDEAWLSRLRNLVGDTDVDLDSPLRNDEEI